MNKTNKVMAHHIEQWLVSGLTKAAYCKNAEIGYKSFLYLYVRYTSHPEPAGFTLLEPKESFVIIKFHLPNGCYFSVPENCSLIVLQKLVQVC
ncbi:MAG: hypothetical protein H7296_02690 [Bacteroidia bacterium]|nr:hypothetical protein [Bacteroidia bacterium]